MPARAWLGYVVAFVLGILTLFPYFLIGGEASSRLAVWAKLVVYAAFSFSPVRLLGPPQFRLVLAFCLPVSAVSLLIGFAETPDLLVGLQIVAEPILCVWLGASLAWVLLRLGPRWSRRSGGNP